MAIDGFINQLDGLHLDIPVFEWIMDENGSSLLPKIEHIGPIGTQSEIVT